MPGWRGRDVARRVCPLKEGYTRCPRSLARAFLLQREAPEDDSPARWTALSQEATAAVPTLMNNHTAMPLHGAPTS